MTPDSGGMKRTHLLREAYETLSGRSARLGFVEKHRSDDVVSGDLFAGDVEGAEVFILDDMISTGGTLLRAAAACRAHGAAHVHAFATHYLGAPGSEALQDSPLIDRIFVTDSVAVPAPSGSTTKLEVISCAPLIAEAILRLRGRGSINRLLNPQAR